MILDTKLLMGPVQFDTGFLKADKRGPDGKIACIQLL